MKAEKAFYRETLFYVHFVSRCGFERHNNHMHTGSKKRRSFVALLIAAGDVKRSINRESNHPN